MVISIIPLPPNHQSVNLFGTLARAVSKSTGKMKMYVPINNSRARGFDYTLEVANEFDDNVINSNL